MARQRPTPMLDAAKLRENALTSIRLGVEDFECSRHQGGDPARALSAIRNLFAGVLLLFKYKIATCVEDPADAAALILNPPEVLPRSDDAGGIEWVPVGNFKTTTIDVGTIRKRFEAFEIDIDWDVIRTLQDCRNHLEHLHPAHTLGEVADFVAELFPVLRNFIQLELGESPAAILGNAWKIMLLHHNFFIDTRQQCEEAWSEACVPEGMESWLNECKCPGCGSTLLAPAQESLDAGDTVEYNDDRFQTTCIACGYTVLIAPLMIVALERAHSYDPRDGDEPSLEGCNQCGRRTFLIHEQSCLWCAAELEYSECEICEENLTQADQDSGGLCSNHAHAYEKFMRED
ncbi:hypothetical protein [Halomonas sp. R57-5]|uniref:hypothetical protein n=1 Tax=Halomonas sp. R57-5 TaxID=1610576 RepID=UPI0006823C0E|nr:hypothetical protein [Halomonas sp. R57-5]